MAVSKRAYSQLPLSKKIAYAKQLLEQTLTQFKPQQLAVAWTGGKDSTLLLWLVKDVCQTLELKLPRIIFIDEGDTFPEVENFIDHLSQEWNLKVERLHNDDVSSQVKNLGEIVKVKNLSQANRKELKRLKVEVKEFPFEPESLIGNHLMKTVPLNHFIKSEQIRVLMTGVRWDEQAARAKDDFIRQMSNPAHQRLEPLLHLSEADVWQITQQEQLPYLSLYEQGYRSLGAASTTHKVDNKAAWEQDLAKTPERAGRAQDKEKIMSRLRDLGYM